MKDLKSKAQELAQYGRNGDTMLAHITPQEAQLLKSMGGSGTINPDTGLPEFFWGSLIGAGIGLLGANKASKSAQSAANTQANAQLEAARIAAEESRFRPVAVTTGFGSSQFTTDPEGRVSGAGYTLTPEMQALRDQIIGQTQQGMGLTQQGLGAAQGLFGLGQQYLAQTPEQAAQQWMASQQAALAPGREQAMSGLMNRLAQTGTQGLGVAQAGGGAANPLMQAFANAQAQQDRELAAQAQQQGRAQTQFGTGLFSDAFKIAQGGYGPLSTQLAQAQGIEQLGQGALDLGTAIGQKVTTANTNAGNLLAQGAQNAGTILGQVQGYNPLASGLIGLSQNQAFTSGLAGLFGGGNTGTTFAGNNPATFDYAYGGGGWY
jgi:hypothetical protein